MGNLSSKTSVDNVIFNTWVYKNKKESEKFTDLEMFLSACNHDQKRLDSFTHRQRSGKVLEIIGYPEGCLENPKVYLEMIFLHDSKKSYFPKTILIFLLMNIIFLFLYINYDTLFLN